ncbi:MAG: hypothetical protein QM784_07325 [Polyangiaceae bacterium]
MARISIRKFSVVPVATRVLNGALSLGLCVRPLVPAVSYAEPSKDSETKENRPSSPRRGGMQTTVRAAMSGNPPRSRPTPMPPMKTRLTPKGWRSSNAARDVAEAEERTSSVNRIGALMVKENQHYGNWINSPAKI